MFLKSLTIKGFKSFADATTLEFEPGVTVVVGPNGSGKSNVVDAVAWVLGAQGARTVRSSKMEEVIFAGTPKRPALGRAEVSLTIDNSSGILPIEFSEVTITRTLFRNGDSEYAINRVPCRLLDIQELLSDTGIGRQQHVIVSQGNLDAILNARPEDRRMVIEEAAGILKYRRRKEKSERRLESTEASLVRLQDLLREVRRQLRPLEKQADAARRYDGLMAELAAVRRHLLGRDLMAVEQRLSSTGRSRRELSESAAGLQKTLAHLDAEVIDAETKMSETLDRTAPDLADMVSRAEGLRARAAGLAAVVSERRRSLERALNATVDHDVIASLEAEAAALSERLVTTDAEVALLEPDAEDLAEAERVLAEETERFEAQWGGANTAAVKPTDPSAEVRGELNALRSAAERGGAELRRAESRLASVDERLAKLSSEMERLAAVVAETQSVADDLRRAEREAAERDRLAAEALTAARESRRVADAEHHRWAAREEALAQALDAARARAGAEKLSETGGVIGTLLDLVDVDEGWAPAFEAAAGEVLSAVVLDGVDSARRGLMELRRIAASGAVVALPKSAVSADSSALLAGWSTLAGGSEGAPAGPTGSAWSAPAGSERLRDRVRGRLPGVDALLDEILGHAVVATGGWEAALDLALARPDLIIVTPDGDRFSAGLWRTGASGAGATGAALEEAKTRAAEAASVAAQAATALPDAEEQAQVASRARATASRQVEANRNRGRASAEALSRVEAEHADRVAETESIRSQHAEIIQRSQREAARIAELEALLPELEELAAAEAEKAAAERAARYQLSERQAHVASLRRDLEVRAAGLEERRALTTRRLKEVEERLRHNVAERDEAAARREAAQAVAVVTEALQRVVRAKEQILDGALTELKAARAEESQARRAETARLEQLRRERSLAERQLSELRERLNRCDLDEAEAKMRLETITESIRRDLDSEPDSVRGAECPELPPGTSASSRRTELERELRLMGPINPLALEEYTALVERNQFLESQLEDVRTARRELAKVIKAIDAEITEVFGAAYADVEENFAKLFATLFPGGEGRIKLADPDCLLDTGIEVEARPSGKNLRRLSLLSGGERSLVAMAFLFAVFRSRPSPFYMMDEVEAALDDVNLHRFLGLINEFRDEAQLLIVSHQKRTMEAGDCLYGVTMAPGGSSRVVSERVTTREAASV